MNYRLFRLFDGEPIDSSKISLEMHVLVRAYMTAWRAKHRFDPVGEHVLENFGVAVDFGDLSEVNGQARPMDSQIRLAHMDKQMADRARR